LLEFGADSCLPRLETIDVALRFLRKLALAAQSGPACLDLVPGGFGIDGNAADADIEKQQSSRSEDEPEPDRLKAERWRLLMAENVGLP